MKSEASPAAKFLKASEASNVAANFFIASEANYTRSQNFTVDSDHRFFFGRKIGRQIFALMLAKSLFCFVMVATKCSQIFVLSQKNGRGNLDFIFLVAKKVKVRDHIWH